MAPAARDLAARGVRIVDPAQIFVDGDVDPARIHAGATLYPGTRLHGRRTFVAPGAAVGTEGPATLVDSVLGESAEVASGYVKGAVLLARAKLGGSCHVREGTLLEEEASTAHAVGLKQTILLSFVTLGSLINFCDVLMAGGTSREDHSEVGSGFIHFNFTPWGRSGDKATPSLVGDARDGVFLRQRRIFLGGLSGLVGPRAVGYGSMTAAGQVVRRDVEAARLVMQVPRALDEPLERSAGNPDRVPGPSHDGLRPASRAPSTRALDAKAQTVREKNVAYIAELHALRAWYAGARLGRARAAGRAELATVYEEAIANIDACIAERVKRLKAYLRERGQALPALGAVDGPACPLPAAGGPDDHVEWVKGLADADVQRARAWLDGIAETVRERLSG